MTSEKASSRQNLVAVNVLAVNCVRWPTVQSRSV